MPIYVNYEGLQQASADVNTVKTKFNEEMEALKKIVGETNQNDWKGPDADLFVNNTSAKIEKLNEEYTQFLEQLKALINENHDVFKETQQRNISIQE